MTGAGLKVFVVGMHRSGTSLVASLLREFGLDLGPQALLIAGNQEDNSAGYFERHDVVAINDELLRRLGGSWSSPPELSGTDWSASRFDDLRARARTILEGLRDPCVLKDPRFSLTLPFWTDGLQQVHVVVCLRNPLDVARSLSSGRAGTRWLAPPSALALWTHYVQSTMDLGVTCVWIDYDSLIQFSERELRRLASALGVGFEACDRAARLIKRRDRPSLGSLLPIEAYGDPELTELYRQALELCGVPSDAVNPTPEQLEIGRLLLRWLALELTSRELRGKDDPCVRDLIQENGDLRHQLHVMREDSGNQSQLLQLRAALAETASARGALDQELRQLKESRWYRVMRWFSGDRTPNVKEGQ